jgi:hypothetical protein
MGLSVISRLKVEGEGGRVYNAWQWICSCKEGGALDSVVYQQLCNSISTETSHPLKREVQIRHNLVLLSDTYSLAEPHVCCLLEGELGQQWNECKAQPDIGVNCKKVYIVVFYVEFSHLALMMVYCCAHKSIFLIYSKDWRLLNLLHA